MKWWRAVVAVAALLIVVVAASGSSPITLVNRLDDRRPPQDSSPALDVVVPQHLPDVVAVPFTALLLFLAGLVLFGLVGLILALELPRWRRRRGVRRPASRFAQPWSAGPFSMRLESETRHANAGRGRPGGTPARRAKARASSTWAAPRAGTFVARSPRSQ